MAEIPLHIQVAQRLVELGKAAAGVVQMEVSLPVEGAGEREEGLEGASMEARLVEGDRVSPGTGAFEEVVSLGKRAVQGVSQQAESWEGLSPRAV